MNVPASAWPGILSLTGNPFVGVEITMGLHGRYHGPRWPHINCLSRMASLDAGYCLDAPEVIPAGGCAWFAEGDMPEQLTVSREPHTVGGGQP